MILTCLSEKEKLCFCSLLLAAVTEDTRITEGEIDCLVRYRIELDVPEISDKISYEEAITYLAVKSSRATQRSILLEIISLLYNDAIISDEESELVKDIASRFKVEDLPAYIKLGKELGNVYNDVYAAFTDLF